MTRFKRFGPIVVLMAAGILISATADRSISGLDIRAMSDAQKNHQVRQDLLSILRPSKSLPPHQPNPALQIQPITTKPKTPKPITPSTYRHLPPMSRASSIARH